VQSLAFLITTSVHDNTTITSMNIINNALADNINVIGVFFYQAGVTNANKNIIIANDEFQPLKAWKTLKKQYNTPLHLCVTAAEKQGLILEGEHSNVDNDFTLSGLGELVELSTQATRIIQL
jgi:tRNA 2-thiouridine synthesizing protein D